MKGADECGVAVAIKHFPGDGVDERDQHILQVLILFLQKNGMKPMDMFMGI